MASEAHTLQEAAMRYLAIRTEQLTIHHGQRRGVDNISLDVEPGEVFGVLGLKGAGKTSLIQSLAGELQPTSGQVLIFGMEYRSRRKQILPRVGYVPQSTCRHLIGTVESRLRSVGSAIGDAAWAEAIRLADQIGLDLHQPLRSLSIQENTLMTLVAAWMHSPDLLLLDEPSRVLTIQQQEVLHQWIRQARMQGKSIFITSSSSAEMERLCDRVAVIHRGALIALERGVNLRAKSLRRVEMRFATPVPMDMFFSLPNLEDVYLEENKFSCVLRGDPDALIKLASRYRVIDLTSQQLSLDEVFRRNYGISTAAA